MKFQIKMRGNFKRKWPEISIRNNVKFQREFRRKMTENFTGKWWKISKGNGRKF